MARPWSGSWFLCCLLSSTVLAQESKQETPRRILVGVEYAMPGMGKTFGALKISAVKPYADAFAWGKMQKTKDAAVDFTMLDRLVKEYQEAGFAEIYLALKSNCTWANRHPKYNLVPKKEFWPQYEAWVQAIVERYDHDGVDDMPGLKRPVRYLEIGTEFSTYQPEPTGEYLEMLERGGKAAKQASKKVMVLHAAFLVTTAFKDRPPFGKLAAAFAQVDKRIMHKTLADMRAVLDRPELFDAVNFHALGDPYEIEATVGWLREEMKQRNYSKPIVISDTTPTPFAAWGPAATDKGKPTNLAIMVPPANDKDRTRLANFFQKLIAKDKDTLAWTQAFVAADMVQKVLVAAEQQVDMINTSFMEDLPLFQTKFLQAGAGLSGWAGMADTKINIFNEQRTVVGVRPGFHALGQLQKHLEGYEGLKRLDIGNPLLRLYEWKQGKARVWCGWVEMDRLLLPGDASPTGKLLLKKLAGKLEVEKMIDRPGQTDSERENRVPMNGELAVPLTVRPVFIREIQ